MSILPDRSGFKTHVDTCHALGKGHNSSCGPNEKMMVSQCESPLTVLLTGPAPNLETVVTQTHRPFRIATEAPSDILFTRS